MMKELHHILEERFAPLVAVVASDSAEALVREKYDSSVSEFFQPFATMSRTVHVRTLKDNELTPIPSMSIRLIDYNKLRPESENIFRSQILQMMKAVNQSSSGKQSIEATQKMLTNIVERNSTKEVQTDVGPGNIYIAPWFHKFRHQVIHGVRFHHCDTFDHPIGILFVISLMEPDPVQKLKQLQSTHAEEFRSFGLDIQWCFYYILLHDSDLYPNNPSCGPSNDHEKTMLQISSEFGKNNTRMVSLQSANLPTAAPRSSSNATKTNIVMGFGGLTPVNTSSKAFVHSRTDLLRKVPSTTAENTSVAMDYFVCYVLLPHIERRIRNLAQFVTEARQGLVSKLFSWFRGNEKDTNQAHPQHTHVGRDIVSTHSGEVRFGRNSVEMQCRRLADLCFMIRDYQTAASYYKILRSDLQLSERPWVRCYLASVWESYGWTQTLLGKIPPTQWKAKGARIEMAMDTFRECGEKQLALRCTLILTYIYYAFSRGDYMAESLRKVWTPEINSLLFVALSMEQAAWCYLSVPSPQQMLNSRGNVNSSGPGTMHSDLRKSALCFTLAGSRYRGDLPDHALRCYQLAREIYQHVGRSWPHIWEHIHDSMARTCMRKRDFDFLLHLFDLFRQDSPIMHSPEFCCRIINDIVSALKESSTLQLDGSKGSTDPSEQSFYSFFNSATHHSSPSRSGAFIELPFPILSGQKLVVELVQGSGEALSSFGATQLRSFFQEAEKGFTMYLTAQKLTHALIEPSRSMLRDPMSTASNDLIQDESVTIVAYLYNPLSIPLQLRGLRVFSTQDTIPVSNPEETDRKGYSLERNQSQEPDDDGTSIEKLIDVDLPPQVTTRVGLSFVPRFTGDVRILGLQCCLNGQINGSITLPSVEQPSFVVHDAAPCLDVYIHPTKPFLFEGQVVKLDVTLTNVSSITTRKIWIKLSPEAHHALKLCWIQNEEESELMWDPQNLVYTLPPVQATLEPWQSCKLNLYIRPVGSNFDFTSPNGHRCHHYSKFPKNLIFLLIACAGDPLSTNHQTRIRLFPFVHTFHVLPTIALSNSAFFISSTSDSNMCSYNSLGRVIVSLQLNNILKLSQEGVDKFLYLLKVTAKHTKHIHVSLLPGFRLPEVLDVGKPKYVVPIEMHFVPGSESTSCSDNFLWTTLYESALLQADSGDCITAELRQGIGKYFSTSFPSLSSLTECLTVESTTFGLDGAAGRSLDNCEEYSNDMSAMSFYKDGGGQKALERQTENFNLAEMLNPVLIQCTWCIGSHDKSASGPNAVIALGQAVTVVTPTLQGWKKNSAVYETESYIPFLQNSDSSPKIVGSGSGEVFSTSEVQGCPKVVSLFLDPMRAIESHTKHNLRRVGYVLISCRFPEVFVFDKSLRNQFFDIEVELRNFTNVAQSIRISATQGIGRSSPLINMFPFVHWSGKTSHEITMCPGFTHSSKIKFTLLITGPGSIDLKNCFQFTGVEKIKPHVPTTFISPDKMWIMKVK